MGLSQGGGGGGGGSGPLPPGSLGDILTSDGADDFGDPIPPGDENDVLTVVAGAWASAPSPGGGASPNGEAGDILTSDGDGEFGTPIALGSGVATFLSTPSSANLRAALTDETGTGAAVFGTGPTIDSPTLEGDVELAEEVSVGTTFSDGVVFSRMERYTTSSTDPEPVFFFELVSNSTITVDIYIKCFCTTDSTKRGRWLRRIEYARESGVLVQDEVSGDEGDLNIDGGTVTVDDDESDSFQVFATAADSDPRTWIVEVSYRYIVGSS